MAKPVTQDSNGLWHCDPPVMQNIPGQGWTEYSSEYQGIAQEFCDGPYKTTQGGNAMPIKAEKQKTGMVKRKLGSRVQKRVQGFSGDWFNRY